jgi:hypothetical protein
MSSSVVLLGSGPLSRSARYARADGGVPMAGPTAPRAARAAERFARTGRARPLVACPPDTGRPSPVAGHSAALIRDPLAGAESHTDPPGHADGFPLTALDAVGARLLAPRPLALRARPRGRTDP